MAKDFKTAFVNVEKQFRTNALAYHQNFSVILGGDCAVDTPIDTGRATANWHISVNNPDTQPIKEYDKTVTAQPTKRRMKAEAKKAKMGDDIYITNAVQGEDDGGNFNGEGYILQLEGGKSQQAPFGMVDKNLNRLQVISEKAIKRGWIK